MTRRTTPLHKNLLTRSDLAGMEVIEEQLLHWQATGWLESIGRLPDGKSRDEDVFAVHAPDLRKELASRLEAIGKSAVLMAPREAKALLLQEVGANTRNDDALATHLPENDLPQVLQEAAAEPQSDVEGVLATAGRESEGLEDGFDAAAPDAFEGSFEADELDAAQLHAAFANWDPWEVEPAMNEIDVPARRAVTARPQARKTSPAIALAPEAMVPVMPAAARASDPATVAMSRVETCLAEVKKAMVAMTQRPEPTAVDLRPLVEVVQAGFEGASRQSAALRSTVLSLSEQLSRSGPQDELGASRTVADAMKANATERSPAGPPQFVAAHDAHLPISLLAMAVLVLCWSLLLWFKTSSPIVALGTIVGAGVVACCLSASRRARR